MRGTVAKRIRKGPHGPVSYRDRKRAWKALTRVEKRQLQIEAARISRRASRRIAELLNPPKPVSEGGAE